MKTTERTNYPSSLPGGRSWQNSVQNIKSPLLREYAKRWMAKQNKQDQIKTPAQASQVMTTSPWLSKLVMLASTLSSMPRQERKKKSLFKKFVAACGSNPKTMIVFSWLAIAYLMPVLFLPWLLIAYVLHSNGVPLAASIFLASIPAFIGLRIHMRWRN